MLQRSLLTVALLLHWPLAAGEDIMAMHPGSVNEIGMGMTVAPRRRVTSEDPPPPPAPLQKNMVRLQLPAPPQPAERRLRIVDASRNSHDGSLNFEYQDAPVGVGSMEIPGLVSPEMLAMDKFNGDAARP
ncbi:MAG: hypothetical protein LIP77_08490, partial [Planctomycetes bacterium]|nr:hypothetical protein [Planctomycetota bacterium]